MKKIVIATTNNHKIVEYKQLLEPHGFEVLSFNDLNLKPIDVIEDGSTYSENSIKKVLANKNLTTLPIISDDSGLEVKALDDKPGIESARFAKSFSSQLHCNNYIVQEVLKSGEFNAKFKCSIALANHDDRITVFEGECEGKISNKVNEIVTFGYDSIFIFNKTNKLFSHMNSEEKNTVSHRALAVKKMVEYLKNTNS